VVNPPARTVIPQPPVRTHATVMLGKGLWANPAGPPQRLTINPGSAGLGVPRGAVRDLGRVARDVGKSERPVDVKTERTVLTAPPTDSGSSPTATSPSNSGVRSPTPPHPSREVTTPRMAPPAPAPRMPAPSAPPARSSKPH
jgi:hypothetical protein